jgi:two-component system OmpR family sensor kinase
VSLRVRLLAITLVLVAAGLSLAGVVTYRYLDSFLVDRVDQQLEQAQPPVVAALNNGTLRRDGFGSGLPPGTVVVVRDANGELVGPPVIVAFHRPEARLPLLPGLPPAGHFTAGAIGGGGSFRVQAASVQFLNAAVPGPGTLLVAVPLDDVAQTLGRLVWIEVAVGLAVLIILGLLASWLIRATLRPLGGIEETAGAIAAGDLSRRVEDADPRTEVGRLGRALNAMLSQIEAAFAERRAAEGRLRQFVADASHELRTPLTSVRGYAELFRRGAAQRPDDLATAMRRIESESARMSVLVDDLLLLARLDQGRPLEREPVDLIPLVADLVTDARAAEPGRPIVLSGDGPVIVQGDEGRLRQVVANLLANARDHTPPETPVRVQVAADGDQAVIEVADEGPGLPADASERVFERFFRVDASRARASGGTGLGLSIVAAIAEAHGGHASAESHPGRGATFRVVLPRAAPAENRPEAAPAPAAAADPSARQ